jgi:hypothetical protein
MWEPRRLTTLWAFTACYRDNFNFLPSWLLSVLPNVKVAYPDIPPEIIYYPTQPSDISVTPPPYHPKESWAPLTTAAWITASVLQRRSSHQALDLDNWNNHTSHPHSLIPILPFLPSKPPKWVIPTLPPVAHKILPPIKRPTNLLL